MRLRSSLLIWLLATGAGCAPFGAASPEPPAHWWKGNLHAHSLWSDGDDYPESILEYYRRTGYHFVAMTDHNIVPVGARWIDATYNPDARAGLPRYRAWFPDVIDERQRGDTTFVRLRRVSEYRMSVEEPNRFLVIPAEEITQYVDGDAVHVNAWNLSATIPPAQHGSEREIFRSNLRAVRDQGAASGRVAGAQINHPNYLYSQTAEDLIALPAARLFELYNGHPLVNNAGDASHPGLERIWDIAVAERLTRGLPPIYGTATDDAHDYHRFAPDERNPGRGWVMVRAPALTPDAIVGALMAGDFYASTGVVLDEVQRSEDQLSLRIRAEEGVEYRTLFIGTRIGYDRTSTSRQDTTGTALTGDYSDEIGQVLADVGGTEPSYEFTGDELYVRAKVVASTPRENAPTPGEYEVAWTQPVLVAEAPPPPDDTLSIVTLNIWHDQRDWPRRLDRIVEAMRALQPDVIALQEVLQHETLPNQAATIARRLGYDHVFASVDSIGRIRRYGNAILTRHPIVARDRIALEPLDDYRNAVHARIAVAGREVDVYVTHLHHTAAGGVIRSEQLAHLQRFVAETRGTGPVVLAGDFNARVEDPEMQPLHARFIDVYGAVHTDSAARQRTTLVPELGHVPRRIDHVFAETGALEPVDARVILDAPIDQELWTSDHFGVHARVRFHDAAPVPDDGTTGAMPALLPSPESMELFGGALVLPDTLRCAVGDTALLPLVAVIDEELEMLVDVPVRAPPRDAAAHCRLAIDVTLAPDRYRLRVGEQIVIEGGSYAAVAMGSVTLLQSAETCAPGICIPHLEIHDAPDSGYRGLLIDVAREWHPIETLEQMVVLARWYKLNQLQLHLTDDQLFTFPTEAFPALPTPGQHYTKAQLRALDEFARVRGVAIVPEIDVPGHAGQFTARMPALFAIQDRDRNPGTLNMGREAVYAALDTIIGEVAAIFATSPYIHIGGDEASRAHLDTDPDVQQYLREHALPDVEELYRHFLVRMNDIVKKHGKRMIVWEGFQRDGAVTIPKDVTVMAWETMYQLPQHLIADGYTVINVSWEPLYVVNDRKWDPDDVYGWNLYRWENWLPAAPSYAPIQLEPTEQVIGASMASWAQPAHVELRSLRRRVPAMSERIWHATLAPERAFPWFERALEATDERLERILSPVTVIARGLRYPGLREGHYREELWFDDTLHVELQAPTGSIIRYTTDGTEPTATSKHYAAPLTLAASTSLRARAFSADGEPAGYDEWREYRLHPIRPQLRTAGGATIPLHDHWRNVRSWEIEYSDTMTIELSSARAGTIRVTTDGTDPTPASPRYEEPLVLTGDALVNARLFSDDGAVIGQPWIQHFRDIRDPAPVP